MFFTRMVAITIDYALFSPGCSQPAIEKGGILGDAYSCGLGAPSNLSGSDVRLYCLTTIDGVRRTQLLRPSSLIEAFP